MALTTPEWLSRHGGELRQRAGFDQWLVLLHGEPQYVLAVVPAAGKYACKVTQTNNGRQLDSGAACATPEEALRTGLDDLCKALGW
jgi:hypothetical protein